MIRQHNKYIPLLLACCASGALANENLIAPPVQTADITQTAVEEDRPAYTLTAGWTSKYVTEGIDCVPGSSIWEVAPSVACKNWTLSAWYASGVSQSYEELDLVLSYTFKNGDWTFTPWYEHQIYFTPDYNVANPAFTVAYALNDWLTVGADAQWKIEHKVMEGYYDLFVQATWTPLENLTINPLVRLGYNSGYNTTADDGANCIDYSLKATYALTDNISVSALIYYTQAATVLRRANLGNEFVYGAYINLNF